MEWIHSYLSGLYMQCLLSYVSPHAACCREDGLLYSVRISDCIHEHPTLHFKKPEHCDKDGVMTTFVDSSTSYKHLEICHTVELQHHRGYMNSNKLKINGDNAPRETVWRAEQRLLSNTLVS